MFGRASQFSVIGTLACTLLFTSVISLATDLPAKQVVASQSLSFKDIAKLRSVSKHQQALKAPAKTSVFTTSHLLAEFNALYGKSYTFKSTIEKPQQSVAGKISHQTFEQYYQGYPIWGHQMAVHTNRQGEVVKLNGQTASGIDESLFSQQVQTKTQADDALTKTIKTLTKHYDADIAVSDKQIEPFVYITPEKQAKLVYHVSFYYQHQTRAFAPNALVDANSLEVLKSWDGIFYLQATGVGGNEKIGQYVYGEDKPYLEVSSHNDSCFLQNQYVKTSHMQGTSYGNLPFEFDCPRSDAPSLNGAYGPLNDAHFHGTKTVQMFKQWLDLDVYDGPIEIKVHNGHNNSYWYNGTVVVGDGSAYQYPASTINAIGHEVSHGFMTNTMRNENMGQSGAIVESFGDITGEALEFYLNGSVDWLVDNDITKNGEPLRYFEHPSLDGQSVEHFNHYRQELGVHQGAGLYNRAFYLLANTSGWDVKSAFSVFAHARAYYWVGYSNFAIASCGVIQAADDRGLNPADVDRAFNLVGLQCQNLPQIDVDNDGMNDIWEARYQLDPNDNADANHDADSDGLTNLEEYKLQSSPVSSDSDGDYLSDYDEVNLSGSHINSWDYNKNNIEDGLEYHAGVFSGFSVNVQLDPDNDGRNSLDEILSGTDPLDAQQSPKVTQFLAESFEQQTLSAGWFIDVQTKDDNRHLWSYHTDNPSHGSQYIGIEFDGISTQTQLSAFLLRYSGYLIFDYAYEGDVDVSVSYYRGSEANLQQGKLRGQWHRHISNLAQIDYGTSEYRWTFSSADADSRVRLDNIYYFESGVDQDGDGMEDYWEHLHYLDFTNSEDAHEDADNDGLTNAQEARLGTNPQSIDTDGDGHSDYAEVNLYHTNPVSTDGDEDGMPDSWEETYGLDTQIDDSQFDFDQDGASNIEEYHAETLPNDINSFPLGMRYFFNDFETAGYDGFDLGDVGRGWSLEQSMDGNHFLRADDIDKGTYAGFTFQSRFVDGDLVFDLRQLFGDNNSYNFSSVMILVDGYREYYSRQVFDWQKVSLALVKGWHEIEVRFYRENSTQVARDFIAIDNFAFFATGRDNDGDGLEDKWEFISGLDYTDASDGGLDSDGDGLTNREEYNLNTSPLHWDSDGDGLSDGAEVNQYSTNPNAVDSDSDNMPDWWEVANRLDASLNDAGVDSDADGVSNYDEYIAGTDPQDPQSFSSEINYGFYDFNDGLLPDALVASDMHSGTWRVQMQDGNGFLSAKANSGHVAGLNLIGQGQQFYVIYQVKTHIANGNHLAVVTSNSGADKGSIIAGEQNWVQYMDRAAQDSHVIKWQYHNNVSRGDVDTVYIDNILVTSEGETFDYDQDGMPDVWEHLNGLNPLDGSDGNNDDDNDGLTNAQEYQLGSSKDNADSDNDGISDGDEVNIYGTNPDKRDSDSDGLTDIEEIALGLNPNTSNHKTDSDGDGLTDAVEYLFGTDVYDAASVYQDFDFFRFDLEDGVLLPQISTSPHDYPLAIVEDPLDSNNKALTYDWDNGSGTFAEIYWYSAFSEGTIFFDARVEQHGQLFVEKDYYADGRIEIQGKANAKWQRYAYDIAASDKLLTGTLFTFYGSTGVNTQGQLLWLDNFTFIAKNRDNDNDGMLDAWEYRYGLDYDDASDALLDADNDGLSNFEEFEQGTLPNDEDTDNDGLSDYRELNELQTNPNRKDSDSDGLNDGWEIANGLDPSQSNADTDTDGDGYKDVHEYQTGSDVNDSQSIPVVHNSLYIDFEQGDIPSPLRFLYGHDGGWQVQPQQGKQLSNGLTYSVSRRGVSNTLTISGYFKEGTLSFDWKGSGRSGSPFYFSMSTSNMWATAGSNWDRESVYVTEGYRVFSWYGQTDTQLQESIAIGFVDNIRFVGIDLDSDGDTIPDRLEINYELNPYDSTDANGDLDGDGLTNLNEYQLGTSISIADSDGDTLIDSDEVNIYKTNPWSSDTDDDGLSDAQELYYSLDPIVNEANIDIDGDGISNIDEIYLFTDPTDSTSKSEQLYVAEQDFNDVGILTNWTKIDNFGQGWQLTQNNTLGVTIGKENKSAIAALGGEFPAGWVNFRYRLNGSLQDQFGIVYGLTPLFSRKGSSDWVQAKVFITPRRFIYWKYGKYSRDGSEASAEIDDVVFIAQGADIDGDGMADQWEFDNGLNYRDPADAAVDNDNDGLTNIQEYQYGTNINDSDTDNDGYSDGYEVANGLDPHKYLDSSTDSDGDGMPDSYEIIYGLDPANDDTALDLDNDGMSNWVEYIYEFEPNNAADANQDADGDGHTNLMELLSGTNPRDARSYPGNISSWFHILLRDESLKSTPKVNTP